MNEKIVEGNLRFKNTINSTQNPLAKVKKKEKKRSTKSKAEEQR